MQPRLIRLLLVGQEHDLGLVGGLGLPDDRVAVLELVLGRHTPRSRRDLLEVAVTCHKDKYRIILNVVGLVEGLDRTRADDLGMARCRILLDDRFQFLDDDIANLSRAAHDTLKLLNLSRQCLGLLGAL